MKAMARAAQRFRWSRACTRALFSNRLPYIRRALKLFEECRKQLGEEVNLLHDVHERVTPNQAVSSPRKPRNITCSSWKIRCRPKISRIFDRSGSNARTPIAMGELFNSPHEWTPLITERLIDYIRVHVSQAGGFTPARKIAILGEQFGVKTAWHGPGRFSIGHMANVTLDVGEL